MKNILKLKKNILLLVCGVIVSIFSQNGWSATNECRIINDQVVPTDFDLGAGVDFTCWAQPDTQRVIFYKIAACKSALTQPTAATPLDLTSCTTLFENTAGAAVDVSVGITNPLEGTFTFPPIGTYNFMYLEVDPTFTYRQAAEFNVGITTSGSVDPAGAICWSNGTPATNFQTIRGNVSCGAALPAGMPASTTVVMNSFTEIAAVMSINDRTFPGGGVISAAFIKTNKTLATATAQAVALAAGTRIAAWGLFPITVTANSNKNYVVSFTNTLGISAMLTSGTNMNGLSVGAFDINITAD